MVQAENLTEGAYKISPSTPLLSPVIQTVRDGSKNPNNTLGFFGLTWFRKGVYTSCSLKSGGS
jgi:hypothetical protein